MPVHNKAAIERGSQTIYNNMIAIYGLKNALRISKMVRIKVKNEMKRRLKMPVGERGLEETDKPKKFFKLKSKAGKIYKKIKTIKKKQKGKGLFVSLCELFDKKGINKVTYQQAKECAKEAKPDSNLSQGHYRWYMKRYKAQNNK